MLVLVVVLLVVNGLMEFDLEAAALEGDGVRVEEEEEEEEEGRGGMLSVLLMLLLLLVERDRGSES